MNRLVFLGLPSKKYFATFCRILYERDLVTGVGGNVSARIKNKFLVTPSGISLRDITAESIVTVECDGGTPHDTSPSKEFSMHRLIFDQRDDVNIVCHVHGSHIIAASTILEPGPSSLPPLTPGFVLFAYPLPLIPFYIPGSPELAETVARYFKNRKLRALLLKNHGLITVGGNMAEALNVAEEVDEAAKIYFLTAGRGSKIGEDLISEISF
ncbi:MAG: class II aldolase/adducin family protein [Deltaproteobacteria bacterium]|nr:class II aldolase/adducin family protein [Deltaproteobacteria bacterium]